MKTNFIDISKWDFYNKVYNYSRTKRMPYVDEAEAKQIREAAPLVKFTYLKSVRAAEQEMLKHLLEAADHMNAAAVMVTSNRIQLLSSIHDDLRMSHLAHSFMAMGESNRQVVVRANSSRLVQLLSNLYWHNRDATLTPVDSEIDALYFKKGDVWAKITNRDSIIQHVYDLGFVCRPGRPPTAVEPTECSIDAMNQIEEVVNVCHQLGVKSRWSGVLTNEAKKLLKTYLTPHVKTLRAKIKNVVIARSK